jgi:hypothetical protein
MGFEEMNGDVPDADFWPASAKITFYRKVSSLVSVL